MELVCLVESCKMIPSTLCLSSSSMYLRASAAKRNRNDVKRQPWHLDLFNWKNVLCFLFIMINAFTSMLSAIIHLMFLGHAWRKVQLIRPY
uniref:Uncharacterized protein n=2 Tax=Physcomitrium patens TaxID=3218 RepID=A0A2K1L266_PHYPA|nr:hypothetical protein PHYPA_002922 [Physcomitrium patens]